MTPASRTVVAGHWLLIENIDRASQDVISLLSPLVHCPREEAWLPDKLMTDLRAPIKPLLHTMIMQLNIFSILQL